ncbi:MAG: hypothetical protein LDL41_01920 [Coleofasciculus sp. S288]|nr:hypothetical protein [Coleofasciculus sp. S288]
MNYPILETQLRLIRALQKGYVEALEAGDWQAADYRCNHLHKLCEGLHHLSQLLDRGSVPDGVTQKSANVKSWVSSIHSTTPTQSQALAPVDKSVVSPPAPETTSELMPYTWDGDMQNVKPHPIDEVW